MSQAIGPFCDLKQDVTSWNYTEGAAVALEMQEYERESEFFFYYFDGFIHCDARLNFYNFPLKLHHIIFLLLCV